MKKISLQQIEISSAGSNIITKENNQLFAKVEVTGHTDLTRYSSAIMSAIKIMHSPSPIMNEEFFSTTIILAELANKLQPYSEMEFLDELTDFSK